MQFKVVDISVLDPKHFSMHIINLEFNICLWFLNFFRGKICTHWNAQILSASFDEFYKQYVSV